MSLREIILLSALLVSLPVCFVRPFYGILVWTVVAFLNPQSYVWSSASVPWAVIVAVPTLAGVLFFTRGTLARLRAREVFLLAILWAWFTATSLVSSSTPLFIPHALDTWFLWRFVSKIVLMTIVTIAIVERFSQLRILIIVTAGCFALFVLKAIPFMIVSGGAFRLYGPDNSMISDNNDFGLALNMTVPLFFCLAQTEPARWARRLSGFLFFVTIPAIFCTYSRGALVGLIAVLTLMFLQLKQRMVLVPVIVLGAAIAVLFAPESWKSRMDLTSPEVVDASAMERFNAWTFSWRLATDFPITGGGFNTFTPDMFLRYAPNPGDVHGPHSIYFGVLAEHGFPGLILYLTLIISCFASLRRTIKTARFIRDERTVIYATTLRFSLIGFLTSGAFLGRAYFDYFFWIVAVVAILSQLTRAALTESSHSARDEVQESLPLGLVSMGA